MFTVVALGPVTCLINGTGSQLTTVNIEGIIITVIPMLLFSYERLLDVSTNRVFRAIQ